jgi:glycosyltransferase involved in cell wall biosynthesis
LARELELHNTEFTGSVPHEAITDLYDAADVFLNGSEIDNQPLSILEAFACGLAVVTTDAGGIPYMVTAERNALVVSRGNYEQLALAAIRLFEDNDLAARLVHEGLEECSKYSWQAVRNQWLELYLRLARRKLIARTAGNDLGSSNTQRQSKVLDRN